MNHLDALTGLYETTRALGLRSDLGQLLDEILDRAKELIGFDHCALMLYDRHTDELTVVRLQGFGERHAEVGQLRVKSSQGLSGWAAAHRQAVRSGDVLRDPRYIQGLEGARSNLAVPLLVQKELVGVINVECRQVDAFTESHEQLLTILGIQAALAIVSSRAKAQLEREIEQLNALYRISQLSWLEKTVEQLVESILAEVQRVIPAGECALLLREDEHLVVLRASREYDRGVRGMRIPVGSGITGRCALSGEVQLVSDVREDPRYIPGVPGALSEVALPLLSQGEVIGVLNAEAQQEGAFGASDVRTLAVIAQQVAAVLETTRLLEETQRLAITDGLTGLSNRRYFESRLDQTLDLARRHGERCCLAILDLDHFKSVNDRYGHPIGDRVLQAVANLLQDSMRTSDLLARFGGEEFTILMHHSSQAGGMVFAERLRARAEALRVGGPEPEGIRLTLSIGVAGYPDHGETGERLMAQADAALYRAKQQGRNRVVLADAP